MRARSWGDEAAAGAFWGLGSELCGGRSASPPLPKPRARPPFPPPPLLLAAKGGRRGRLGSSALSFQLSSFPGRSGAAPALETPPAPGAPASRPWRRGRRGCCERGAGRRGGSTRGLQMPRRPARRAPFAGYITGLPAGWAALSPSRGWGAREREPPPRQTPLAWPRKMQQGGMAPRRAQPGAGGAAPLIPIFSIFGTGAKLLGSQGWGAGGARRLHLFEPGPGSEATPRPPPPPNNVPGSLAWVPAAPDRPPEVRRERRRVGRGGDRERPRLQPGGEAAQPAVPGRLRARHGGQR